MAHIHTKPGEHDLTVSAFIIRMDFDEPKLMMHLHKKLNKWLQFGGHVELNEDPWEALTHELLEESGYDMNQLSLIEVAHAPKLSEFKSHPIPFCINTHPFSDEHSHTDLAYAFTTDQSPQHTIGDNESKDIRLFTKAELTTLSNEEIFKNVREIGLFVFDNLIH